MKRNNASNNNLHHQDVGEEAVRRIQRLWRRYQHACVEATAALFDRQPTSENQNGQNDSTSSPTAKLTRMHNNNNNQNQKESNGISNNNNDMKTEARLVELAKAARRIQMFWRRLYTAAGVPENATLDDDDDDEIDRNQNDDDDDHIENGNKDDQNRRHHHHHSFFPENHATAAQSIQRRWRRYRQALLDQQEDERESLNGGDNMNDKEQNESDKQDENPVEQCLRELQAECESLAGSIEDINSSIFGNDEEEEEEDEDGNEDDDNYDDDDFEDDEDDSSRFHSKNSVLRIQRWWRKQSLTSPKSSAEQEARNNHDNNVQDDAQRQNVASNEIAAVTSSASTSETEEDRRRAESAIRALQLRFRLRRLRVIFHERDRSEAAERLQRAWRVKMTRDQHQRQLREGMRDGAARIIQHAFRTSSSFHGGKNSGEEEQHQEKQNDQNEMDRIAYRRAQERLLVERARVAAGNQRNLLSDDDDDDDRRKRNNQNTVLLPQCVVCLGEVVQVCLLPCRHTQLCVACGAVLRRCPTCRAIVAMRIRVFL